ncbi:uncharacterized protein TNCV_3183621 [Trichonephila clavipes]|uniref:Methyltransferase type 11 domain-containing protein n=1 Tax=Trichonephila clavipes TaxID=2585209 RepID=A0A8X6VG71_TRICX|nr:uncharacterized protein TNCV_3183621 [Trichonephila clavipes]
MDTNLSIRDAVDFINKLKNEFDWQDLSRDTIMDIGCGDRFYCSQAIIHLYSDFKCLIACDKSEDLLRWRPPRNKQFEKLHKNNIIKLLVADIENSTFFEDYTESVDKIVSRNVLYQVHNKLEALRNIYKTLKPGGAAAVLFWLDNPIVTWANKMISTRKWSRYVERSKPLPPYFPAKLPEHSYWAEMKYLGCRDVHTVIQSIPYSFSSDEECRGQLASVVDEMFNIPPERREEFNDDCLRIFKQLVGCKSGGSITFDVIDLFLHIVK